MSVKFVLNSAGVKELLQSSEMMSICKTYAEQVASRAGDGYEVTTYTGAKRVNASVHADTPEAVKDTFTNNTLIKALYG